jgi:hypothetical protein
VAQLKKKIQSPLVLSSQLHLSDRNGLVQPGEDLLD